MEVSFYIIYSQPVYWISNETMNLLDLNQNDLFQTFTRLETQMESSLMDCVYN